MIFRQKDTGTQDELTRLHSYLQSLEAAHGSLCMAHNELFDFLAGELGFQSKMMPGYWPDPDTTSSPRRLRMVRRCPRVFRTGKDKDDDAATG